MRERSWVNNRELRARDRRASMTFRNSEREVNSGKVKLHRGPMGPRRPVFRPVEEEESGSIHADNFSEFPILS